MWLLCAATFLDYALVFSSFLRWLEVKLTWQPVETKEVRIPAACCGIVGLKPAYGLVPYTGIMPIEFTLDHTGPMARTVYDTALMLEVGQQVTTNC